MKKVFLYPLIVLIVYFILFFGTLVFILVDPTSALGWIWVITGSFIFIFGWIPLILAVKMGGIADKENSSKDLNSK